MSDCILTTDPSVNTILVTNNLFSINCGALARGVVSYSNTFIYNSFYF